MPPGTTPDPLWDVVVAERARLLADLEPLTPDQWAVPSTCGRWSVKDVVVGYARRDVAVRSRTVARGLTLVADDGGFRTGHGPSVRGTTLDLVLAVAGRPAAVGRLTGDGVAELAARVAPAVGASDPSGGT